MHVQCTCNVVLKKDLFLHTETAIDNLSSCFTSEALLQLERCGIPVLTELASKSATSADVSNVYKWLLTPGASGIKSTWENLLLRLRLLSLNALSQQIESHLGRSMEGGQ